MPLAAVNEKATHRSNGPTTDWAVATFVVLDPTTWPRVFTPCAALDVPPSMVPRSTTPAPAVHENACVVAPPSVDIAPTTWPVAFTA